jgi:aminoglycoside phosphotransferase (APT) family kinase protein
MHPNQREMSSLPVELRRTTVPAQVRAWVEQATGSPIRRIRRLPGASTSAVHGLWFADGTRLVLRRYVWPYIMEEEPDVPPREVDALRFAAAHGLAAPEVIAADPTGEEIGDGVAVLLMTFLPGQAVGVPDLHRLAEVAADIHAIDATGFGHRWFPWYDCVTRPPGNAEDPKVWERALEIWHGPIPPFGNDFIHRDFHPGNVLWSRGRATGVVDWPNGCRGPWQCDIGHCWVNLVEWADLATADRFVTAYQDLTGRVLDPFWEIAQILEYSEDAIEESCATYEPRLAAAIAAIT